MSEKIIQIDRAETDLWKLVKSILKIADGEKGTLKIITRDSKDSYVILQIIKLPKEQYVSTPSLGKETMHEETFKNTPKATK